MSRVVATIAGVAFTAVACSAVLTIAPGQGAPTPSAPPPSASSSPSGAGSSDALGTPIPEATIATAKHILTVLDTLQMESDAIVAATTGAEAGKHITAIQALVDAEVSWDESHLDQASDPEAFTLYALKMLGVQVSSIVLDPADDATITAMAAAVAEVLALRGEVYALSHQPD